MKRIVVFLLIMVAARCLHAQPSPGPSYQELFNLVWQTIDGNFYDPSFGGVDWKRVRQKYSPEVPKIRDDRSFIDLAYRMMRELHVSHLELHPAQARQVSIGIRASRLEGQLVITHVAVGSDAERQNVRVGDVVLDDPGQLSGVIGTSMTVHVPRVSGIYTTRGIIDAMKNNGGAAAFFTEDVGSRRYRGKVILLINEKTGSAAEGFAWMLKGRNSATLVGGATAGALLGGETFDLPGGWTLTVPTHASWGPDGKRYVDTPVTPDMEVKWTRQHFCEQRDPDMARALDLLNAVH